MQTRKRGHKKEKEKIHFTGRTGGGKGVGVDKTLSSPLCYLAWVNSSSLLAGSHAVLLSLAFDRVSFASGTSLVGQNFPTLLHF
jgi:hypothetical protein